MLKQVFLARFELVVTRFGPWKIPTCLEKGLFSHQKWVKKASKHVFSKSDHGALGVLKEVFLAHWGPLVTRFGPCTTPKCLENGFGSKNGSKMGPKCICPKVIIDHVGCSNKCL